MKSSTPLKSSRFIGFLLIICGACILLFYMPPYLRNLLHYKAQEQLYMELSNTPIKSPPRNFSSTIINSYNHFTTINPDNLKPTIHKKLLPLLEINKEVIGWITINDTPINYPLLQHSDNQYYLTHASDNSDSIYGSIYIDHRNNSDLNNLNTLIYGHNMNNGSMFHALVNYKDQDFFTAHPYISVSNLYETFTYEIFSVYVVNADTETISVKYKSNEDFLNYISNCQSRSLFKTNINLNEDDQIITLVTCSYELDNARTIVQAKKIK